MIMLFFAQIQELYNIQQYILLMNIEYKKM